MKSKSRWLAQTLYLNVCDAPEAQFGQSGPPALTCPFGTSQTPHVGVCANLNRVPESWNLMAGGFFQRTSRECL